MSDDLAEVRDYQTAARTILRDPTLGQQVRESTLLRLVRRAREGARWPEACIRAMTAEVEFDIDRLSVETPEAGDRYERAQLSLRRQGYTRCPHCLGELATEEDVRRWQRMRRERLDELIMRERAIR